MREEFHYLCDGKRCETCSPECYHTGDLARAINFTHEPTEEEKRDRFILIKSCESCEYFERMEYVK